MKITISTVKKWLLTELDALDPVSVILEDFAQGLGKITIECYGKSWSNYWGGMGNRSIQQFFLTAGNDYLAEKLAPTLAVNMPDDGAALVEAALAQVDVLETYGDIAVDDACDLKYKIRHNLRYNIEGNEKLLNEVFGSEWWHHLP